MGKSSTFAKREASSSLSKGRRSTRSLKKSKLASDPFNVPLMTKSGNVKKKKSKKKSFENPKHANAGKICAKHTLNHKKIPNEALGKVSFMVQAKHRRKPLRFPPESTIGASLESMPWCDEISDAPTKCYPQRKSGENNSSIVLGQLPLELKELLEDYETVSALDLELYVRYKLLSYE